MTDEYPLRCRDKIFIRDVTRISEHILASVRTFVLVNGHRYIISILCLNILVTRRVIDATAAG